jgi:hypothetical protein
MAEADVKGASPWTPTPKTFQLFPRMASARATRAHTMRGQFMKIDLIISHGGGQEADRSCSETSVSEFLLQCSLTIRPHRVRISPLRSAAGPVARERGLREIDIVYPEKPE